MIVSGARAQITHARTRARTQVRSYDSHNALMENSRLRLLSETQKTQVRVCGSVHARACACSLMGARVQLEEKLKYTQRPR